MFSDNDKTAAVETGQIATTVRAYETISNLFFEAARKYAGLPAMGISGEDDCLDYRRLADLVRRRAASIGLINKLQPIGILSENRPEWGITYLAILAAGGMVAPIDPLLKEEELKRIIDASGINRLFVSERYQSSAIVAAKSISRRVDVFRIDEFASLVDTDSKPPSRVDADSPAVLIFTSGTMGKPKKVVLTHRNILSDMEGIEPRLKFGPGDTFLSVLPLHHTFEATCGFIVPILSGCTIYYVRELNSKEILSGIARHGITHFISVPLLYEKIYHGILGGVRKASPFQRMMFKSMMAATKSIHAATGKHPGKKLFSSFRKKAGLETVQLMVSGGAPLPAEISRDFNLLGIDFVEGYGLTETSPVLAVNPPGKVKFGSVGPPLANVAVKIADPDDKGIGEIFVKGPMVSPGYLDDPEETARIFENGWLKTGDLGKLDNDGYLFIMGRKKNLIVSAAGKNIYPEEIEAELLRSPYILESIVYGKKVPSGREEVAAVIHPDFAFLESQLGKKRQDTTELEIKQIIDAEVKSISSGMADFKRIKHISYSFTEFEKTSTRKIKRRKQG